MTQYISKDDAAAEIKKRRLKEAESNCGGYKSYDEHHCNACIVGFYEEFLEILNTLEVKEIKLPNPRFPHLNNIVDKVFGTGNLESFEYEEAEQLVFLAKEELLKDLEVKEVDLDKIFNDEYSKFSNDTDAMDYAFPIDLADFKDFAKHFFELGVKAQKGDKE